MARAGEHAGAGTKWIVKKARRRLAEKVLIVCCVDSIISTLVLTVLKPVLPSHVSHYYAHSFANDV